MLSARGFVTVADKYCKKKNTKCHVLASIAMDTPMRATFVMSSFKYIVSEITDSHMINTN